MAKKSAGLLLFRRRDNHLEVLLVHPGGPLWARKDEGAWSIPKGEIEGAEDPLSAAKREFDEELGSPVAGDFIQLDSVRQAGGKQVYAWAVESDFDCTTLRSGTFTMEWPPRSGGRQEFPEVDRAAWFSIEIAQQKILASQAPLLASLMRAISRGR